MQIQTQTSDLNLDAIAWGVCETSQGEVADALDGYAGYNADDCEDDKGCKVKQNEETEYEGRI